MGLILLYLFGAFVCGGFAGAIAADKHRGGCLFFVLGFIIGPFAILGAAMLSRDQAAETSRKLARGDLLACPACREPVQPAATVCPHCRTPIARPRPPAGPPPIAERLGRWASRFSSAD